VREGGVHEKEVGVIADTTLITGANGYVGQRLARSLLRDTDERLLLWLHASSRAEAQEKERLLAAQLGNVPAGRVAYASGDLRSEQPFDGVSAPSLRRVIHAAAVTRFNVEPELAQAVNVEGTRKVLQLARRAPSLDRFVQLSTVYSSGLNDGDTEELPWRGARSFANYYESSKHDAEALVYGEDAFPWQVVRISTLLSDDETGQVTQFNAVHNTLKLIYYGLISVVPGEPDTRLYFVNGDFVQRSLERILRMPLTDRVLHVCHREEESIRLEDFLSLSFQAFSTDASFRARRVMAPLLVDYESFRELLDGTLAFTGEIVRQALRTIAPFAKQMFVHKKVSNERLRATVDDYRAPDPKQLVRNVSEYLTRTRWGRTEDGALAEVG
jgi:nucleoside-diphosphate-sugar epimerase